jgi:Transmembrane domain of unknown function (DUF3566)
MGDDQDTRPGDIMAPPKQPPRKSAAATSDDAVSDGTADGGRPASDASASGKGIDTAKDASANGTSKEASRTAVPDDTIVDGVPALPADTIRSPRARPKEPEPDQQKPPAKAAEQPPAADSPAYSFGPGPSASAWSSAIDQTVADPAGSAAKPSGDDPSPTAPSGTAPSGSPASAESPSVSPAAFAWEMPDPPPHSRSSPARTFLRSGAGAKSPAPPQTAPSTGPSARQNQATAAAAAAAAQSPVTVPNGTQKTPKQKAPKGQSKRAARRQAHLTIARVEPWSVMKFSFVVSLVAFVILFVAVSVLYAVLNSVGVFDSIQHVVTSVTSSQTSAGVNAKAWFSASKVLGYTALLGSANIVLITAMATIGAVVYNLTSRLVGGVEVTLRETE